jgi:endonuclease YncB( thermonuclease family)
VAADRPTLLDTATLEAAGQTIKLFGIVGEAGASADGMKGYIAAAGDSVACEPHANAEFICRLPDGTDIAMAALVNGAAQVRPDAPDAYQHEQLEAQTARRGIWASLPPPPVQVTHPTAQDTATLLANGQTYVLDGIEGVGGEYAHNLQGYIAANGDTLLCQPQGGDGYYACLQPDGTDLAKVVLVNGAARVAPDAPDAYRLQQAEAIRNRRGIWANLTPVVAEADIEALSPLHGGAVVPEDPPDGLTYVGDTPTAVIDGETVFFLFVAGSGWGYWDHDHHWRGAPDRFGRHLDRFHPGGRGLRGYDAHGGFDARRFDQRHIETRAPFTRESGYPVGGGAPGHPGPVANGMRPGAVAGNPGGSGSLSHQQAMAAQHATPTMARPAAGSFVHPTAGNLGQAAPAIHVPSGGGKCAKKC